MSFPFPNLLTILMLGASVTALAGCAAEQEEEDVDDNASELSALRDGVNSNGCRRSAYNCGLHPDSKSQRVLRADGKEDWAVDPAWLKKEGFVDPVTKEARVPVVDGNGDLMGLSKKTEL